MLEYEDDIRSDMSRFHGIGNFDAITAHKLVSFAMRLAVYDGCLAAVLRRELTEEQEKLESHAEQSLTNAVAFNGTVDALESNPLFAGLGSYSSAPATQGE